MTMHWMQILKSTWHVLWISTVYSYACCGVVSLMAGYRTKGDKVQIDLAVERFIISPFYVATLFTLISVLFYQSGVGLVHTSPGSAAANLIAFGTLLFLSQLGLELLESTFIQNDFFRLLKDPDALRLFGTAALIYSFLVVMVVQRV